MRLEPTSTPTSKRQQRDRTERGNDGQQQQGGGQVVEQVGGCCADQGDEQQRGQAGAVGHHRADGVAYRRAADGRDHEAQQQTNQQNGRWAAATGVASRGPGAQRRTGEDSGRGSCDPGRLDPERRGGDEPDEGRADHHQRHPRYADGRHRVAVAGHAELLPEPEPQQHVLTEQRQDPDRRGGGGEAEKLSPVAPKTSRLVRLETGSSSEAELASRAQATWCGRGGRSWCSAAVADDGRQQHDGGVEAEHRGRRRCGREGGVEHPVRPAAREPAQVGAEGPEEP